MVGKLPTLLTGAQKPNGRTQKRMDKPKTSCIRGKAKPRSGAKLRRSNRGWMSEKHLLLRNAEKCFLLTSPFIEPAPPWQLRALAQLYGSVANTSMDWKPTVPATSRQVSVTS